jgi:hypothetical protein
MSETITEFAPAGIAVRPVQGARNGAATRAENVVKPTPTCNAETDLWKLTAGPAPRLLASIRLTVFGLFFVAGLIAMINGFAELSHLLQSDSVGYVAEIAIDESR